MVYVILTLVIRFSDLSIALSGILISQYTDHLRYARNQRINYTTVSANTVDIVLTTEAHCLSEVDTDYADSSIINPLLRNDMNRRLHRFSK